MNIALAEFVRERAGQCYEYCRMPPIYDELPFEIEHVARSRRKFRSEGDKMNSRYLKTHAWFYKKKNSRKPLPPCVRLQALAGGTEMGTRWGIAVALVVVAGCGFPGAKLDEAKGHVQQALEVWKKGGKPDELMSLNPPIEFHEVMWNAGEKLVNFEVGAARYVKTANVVRCETQLTVRNRRGKERTEAVVYDVSLESPVKIVNNPMP